MGEFEPPFNEGCECCETDPCECPVDCKCTREPEAEREDDARDREKEAAIERELRKRECGG